MDQCDLTVEGAKVASANAALVAAQASFMQCLPTSKRAEAALTSVKTQDALYASEADQLNFISNFLNSQTTGGLDSIKDMAHKASESLKKEIDDLKADIRKERRIFLDSGAQISPAVGGLYFTLVPDNQILIAFLSCLGSLMLFMSALIFLNKIPIAYFSAMTFVNRLVFVGSSWIFILILTYVSFFSFT
jgi:hypothetical protein